MHHAVALVLLVPCSVFARTRHLSNRSPWLREAVVGVEKSVASGMRMTNSLFRLSTCTTPNPVLRISRRLIDHTADCKAKPLCQVFMAGTPEEKSPSDEMVRICTSKLKLRWYQFHLSLIRIPLRCARPVFPFASKSIRGILSPTASTSLTLDYLPWSRRFD